MPGRKYGRLNTGVKAANRVINPNNKNKDILPENLDESGYEVSRFCCVVCKCRDDYT